MPARTGEKIAPPNLRAELPPDLAQEMQEALGDMSVDDLLAAESRGVNAAVGIELEPESRVRGKVVKVHGDDVFLDLPNQNQGLVSLRQFAEPPELGAMLDVLVLRFNAEDGLYEVSLPEAAVEIGDWSQVTEGMIVDAIVTGPQQRGPGSRGQSTPRVHSGEPSRRVPRRTARAIRRAKVHLRRDRGDPERRNLCSAAGR